MVTEELGDQVQGVLVLLRSQRLPFPGEALPVPWDAARFRIKVGAPQNAIEEPEMDRAGQEEPKHLGLQPVAVEDAEGRVRPVEEVLGRRRRGDVRSRAGEVASLPADRLLEVLQAGQRRQQIDEVRRVLLVRPAGRVLDVHEAAVTQPIDGVERPVVVLPRMVVILDRRTRGQREVLRLRRQGRSTALGAPVIFGKPEVGHQGHNPDLQPLRVQLGDVIVQEAGDRMDSRGPGAAEDGSGQENPRTRGLVDIALDLFDQLRPRRSVGVQRDQRHGGRPDGRVAAETLVQLQVQLGVGKEQLDQAGVRLRRVQSIVVEQLPQRLARLNRAPDGEFLPFVRAKQV